ncbi:hypothetical protein ACT4UM_04655, partial [Bacillus sp. SS-TM]
VRFLANETDGQKTQEDKVKVKEDRNDYDLHQKNKVRLIDPPLLREGKIVQSSVVSENIRQISDIAYEKAVRGMYVKVISN